MIHVIIANFKKKASALRPLGLLFNIIGRLHISMTPKRHAYGLFGTGLSDMYSKHVNFEGVMPLYFER